MAKKNNKVVKIKGAKPKSKIVVKDQKLFDSNCEYSIMYKVGHKWNQNPLSTYRYMECKLCGSYTEVGETATSSTCHQCVMGMVEPPHLISQKVSTGRPAGWHWMQEFVDQDGTVFHRGKEQPKLKGTLEPTKIEAKKRLKKKDKERVKREASVRTHKLKKQLAKAKWKKDKKPIMAELKKLQKLALGKFPKNFNLEKFLAE